MRGDSNLYPPQGFTLVEIVAVLVILALLAALAIPKFTSLHNEARIKTAMAAIDEVKGRYNTAAGVYMLQHNGSLPATAGELLTDSAATSLGPDFTVTVESSSSSALITVTHVQGAEINPPANGTWTMPTN